jgi:hypothetical protein
MTTSDPFQQRLESLLGKKVIPPGDTFDYDVQLDRSGILEVAKFCYAHRHDMPHVSRGGLKYPLIKYGAWGNKMMLDSEVLNRKPEEGFTFIEEHLAELLQAMQGDCKERSQEGRKL